MLRAIGFETTVDTDHVARLALGFPDAEDRCNKETQPYFRPLRPFPGCAACLRRACDNRRLQLLDTIASARDDPDGPFAERSDSMQSDGPAHLTVPTVATAAGLPWDTPTPARTACARVFVPAARAGGGLR